MRAWLGILAVFLPLPSPAGLIITPAADCWLWLAPPQMVRRAVENFQAESLLTLAGKLGLNDAAELSLELLGEVRSGALKIAIEEGQVEAFHFDTASRRLSLSREAATTLLAAEKVDPARLVITSASADPALTRAWLAELAELRGKDAWDASEMRDDWLRAFDGPAAAPGKTPRQRALELYDQLTAQPDATYSNVLRRFGPREAPAVSAVSLLELEVAVQLEDFAAVFRAWGSAAAALHSARLRLENAERQRDFRAAELAVSAARDRYLQIESILRRALGQSSGLIVTAQRLPAAPRANRGR